MEKRFQIFISSTFRDLQDERQEVIQALLELNCIPAGMELFPAANEDQWTLIKRVIDDCDYYMVIIGGRYGSTGPEGLSFTEMEYRYAVEQGKPVLAFIHRNPELLASNRTELSEEGRAKLAAFRELAQERLVRYWTTPADLGSVVSRSVVNLMRTTPAIGWVKADQVSSPDDAIELLALRRRIEELEGDLVTARLEAPQGSEDLAQGNDELFIRYSYKSFLVYENDNVSESSFSARTTWNEVFASIAPLMLGEASEYQLQAGLARMIADNHVEDSPRWEADPKSFRVDMTDFDTIKVQLRALGLITQSKRPRAVKDTATYWTLTPYGEQLMNRLRAIRRD